MFEYGFIVQFTLLLQENLIYHNYELFYELLPLYLKCKYAA